MAADADDEVAFVKPNVVMALEGRAVDSLVARRGLLLRLGSWVAEVLRTGRPLSLVVFRTARSRTVTCPGTPVSLAPRESLTRTSTYTITEADVTAESVAASATAHAAFSEAVVDSAVATATISQSAAPTPTATSTAGRSATPPPTNLIEPGRAGTSTLPIGLAICILLSGFGIAASCFRRQPTRNGRK